ncbi:MAG: preprotein translocase subunit YajC [Gammaproteobacteria bacterium]|nr:preprotein translocase subunit YajC [Gammaproteobacteria bacterium]
MNLFFIENAWADAPAAAGAQSGNPMSMIIMMGGMFAIFYFLLIRPQQKRAKEHKAMIDAIAKGDEVVAAGGLLGRVTHIADNIVTIEIADKVEIKVQRPAIQAVLPKGTIK